MVQHYKKFIVFTIFLSYIHDVQPGVFIVYPFKESDIMESKPRFPVNKFDTTSTMKSRNRWNDTGLHLIYPTQKDFVIMTPAPVEKYDHTVLDTTTIHSAPQDSLEEFATSTQVSDADADTTATDEAAFMDDIESTTMQTESFSTSTDFITTDDNTNELYTTETASKLLQIYEAGPEKILRKRMDKLSKLPRKYPSNLIMNNELKMPTTESPAIVFKEWYKNISRNKLKTLVEKLRKTATFKNLTDEELIQNSKFRSNVNKNQINEKQLLKMLTG